MTRAEVLLAGTVFVPTLGAFLLPLLGPVSRGLRNALALVLVVAALVGSLSLLGDVAGGGTITKTWALPLGMNFVLHADGLAVFMGIVSSLISSVIVLYSLGYISHYRNQNEYYLMVVLFLGSMMGLVYSGNLISMYVFWEITAICSWRLIGFFREPQQVIRADKAFLVTVVGALAMLLGFVMLAFQASHGSLQELSFDMARVKGGLHGNAVPMLAGILILMGILSKSATLPFHTWLPDAGVAPSPVTALLHAAVLVKIGVYVYARLFIVNFVLPPELHTALLWIAAASALVAGAAALIDTDIKRIIAYSTISQIGFIFLGFGLTGDSMNLAWSGALLYILMHGIAKGGLFLCAGIIEQNTHTKDIRQMGGLIKTMPVTAVSFLFCAFSVMGLPPFGGFFSKFMVIGGAVAANHVVLAIVFLAAAVLTILYLLRVFLMVFMGSPRGEAAKEGSAVMVGSVALLGMLSLATGIFVGPWSTFAQAVAKQMLTGSTQ